MRALRLAGGQGVVRLLRGTRVRRGDQGTRSRAAAPCRDGDAHLFCQTALAGVRGGYEMHVAADACCSREDDNHANALLRLGNAGAVVTTSESAAYGSSARPARSSSRRSWLRSRARPSRSRAAYRVLDWRRPPHRQRRDPVARRYAPVRRLLWLVTLATLAITAGRIRPLGRLGAHSDRGRYSPLGNAGTIDVQWWMEAEPGQVIAIVSTTIDPSVSLPARVRLPIPPGMSVDWAGEISGADVTQDVQRQFSVGQGEGAEYAEFEVSTFRAAQIDLSGIPLTPDGDRVSASLNFVQSVPSSETAFTVRLPPVRPMRRSSPRLKGRQAPTRTASPSTRFRSQTEARGVLSDAGELPAVVGRIVRARKRDCPAQEPVGRRPRGARGGRPGGALRRHAQAAFGQCRVRACRHLSEAEDGPEPQRRAEPADDVDSDEPFLLDD